MGGPSPLPSCDCDERLAEECFKESSWLVSESLNYLSSISKTLGNVGPGPVGTASPGSVSSRLVLY